MKNIYLTLILIASTCLFIGCGEDEPVYGCMDESASNYNADATEDDPNNPCTYAPSEGCMDSTACNYNSDATEDDGSCQFPSENALTLVNSDAITVIGSVNEEIVAYIDIRNESCEEITISASQVGPGVQPAVARAKFCLGNNACYGWSQNTSLPEDDLAVASFEETNGVTGYLEAFVPGTYTMTYTIESCCGEQLELDVTFIAE